MQGNGPTGGSKIKSGWVVSGDDPLAVDTLAAQIMGFDLKDIGYFNLLKEAGFGSFAQKPKFSTPYSPHSTFESQRNWQT